MSELTLDGESLDPRAAWNFARQALDPKAKPQIRFTATADKKIERASSFVQDIVKKDKPVYGINTGFGKFAEVSIAPEKLRDLQRNLVLSHACGYGPALSRDLVLSMWVLRLNTLSRGNSGVRPETLREITALLEAGVLAEIPSRGSVGASGDLSPSAHATLPLLGEGFVTRPHGVGFEKVAAQKALTDLKKIPWVLGPKEGLSLINGTQLTASMALKTWFAGENLLRHANLAAALSIEGLRGSHRITDEGILNSRRHPGAARCGAEMAKWFEGESTIATSHEGCGKVQDPYSLRCAPQVHGAIADALAQAEEVLKLELNSSTDNPLLFPERNLSISGGNFHAMHVARVADSLASALTSLGAISERRTALAMSPSSSGLPAFLIEEGGLNSGFMMAHVTAASLVSESKALSFPASVDSIPTSDDREDHVSMGPAAGFKALQICEHIRGVIAIEILAACQALDLLAPNKAAPRLEKVRAHVRKIVPHLDADRILANDIQKISDLIDEGSLLLIA